MKKFNIGQRVRIRRSVVFYDYIDKVYINSQMKNMAGKESIIKNISYFHDRPVYHLSIDDRWVWAEKMIELAEEEWD